MTVTGKEIPANWTSRPLKYIFSILNGSTPSSSEPSYWNGDIFWATPEDIGSLSGPYLYTTKRKITEEGYRNSGTQLAPEDSIILTTRAPVGNLAISKIPVCTNQGCKLLVKKTQKSEERYYYYQLLARTEELQTLATGTTFVELGTEELSSFQLLVPPSQEQSEIANYLDRNVVHIDLLIGAKERLLNLLKEKRNALISHAVTHGINPEVPTKQSGIAWLDVIPQHWDVKKIGYLFRERDERNRPELPLLNVSIRNGVTLRELSDTHVEQMAENFSVYKVAYAGDVSFNKMRMWQGAVGVVPVTGLVSPDYVVAHPIAPIDTFYFGELFRTSAFSAESARNSHGIVWDRLRLYWEEFRDIWVPLPPLEEQHAIVNFVRQETQRIDELSLATEKTISLLKERRLSLITAAVTGKLHIPEK